MVVAVTNGKEHLLGWSRSFQKKDIEKYAQDTTSYNLMKKIKTIIGMEIQHRLMVMNKLGLLTDVMKRFFIDENLQHYNH